MARCGYCEFGTASSISHFRQCLTLSRIPRRHHFARVKWTNYDKTLSGESLDSEPVASNRVETLHPQTTAEPGPPSADEACSICDLPTELLSYIVHDARTDDPKIPTHMGAVNRRFNAFTKASPSLWDIININTPIEEVSRCIVNSKDKPLDVSLSVSPQYAPKKGLMRLEAFDNAFGPAALNRVRSFTAITTEVPWSRVAIEFLTKSTPHLSQLDAVSVGLENPYGDPSLVIHAPPIFSDLIDLSVHRVEFHENTFPVCPLLLKLKVERCMTDSYPSLLRVIGTMSSLQCLILRDIHGSSLSSDQWDPPMFLPHLTSLEIDLMGIAEIGIFCETIKPLNLKSLIISPWGTTTHDTDPERLRMIIKLFASTLSELHIRNGLIDDWASLFSTLRALTHLHLISSAFTDVDLASLAGPSGIRGCPKLVHLAIDNIKTFSSGVLKTVIQDRHTSGPLFESLVVRDCYEEQFAETDVREISGLVHTFQLGWLDVEGVYGDQDNSMANTSSADDSTADISSSCLIYIPEDWLIGKFEDRWMRLRSGRYVFPVFPSDVSPLVE